MIKAVIFDMDGLLIDSEMISYQCYRQLLKSYGYEFTKEDYIRDYPGKQLTTSLEYIKEHYHLNYDIQEKIQLFHHLEKSFMETQGVPLKAGACQLLKHLVEHQYRIALATSSLAERACQILSEHQVLDYFDVMVYGSDVSRGKPFPDIFLKACEKLNVLPCEAVVFEDSEAGIQAAYDAHIPVYCIPDLKYPSQDHIDKTQGLLSSLNEAIALFP